MSTYVIGEFEDAQATAAAIEALKLNGFEVGQLDVFSGEPVELGAGVLERPSRMSLVAVGGAVTVCLIAIGFVRYTQHDFPLITGGMPLFSFWATGVIFYEMTMLGAIAATFLTFLWESGLLRRTSQPVPVVSPHSIDLRVRCEGDQIVTAGECLYQAGAAKVTRMEKR